MHSAHEHSFDKYYWEQHWNRTPSRVRIPPPNPYLREETRNLTPGTALDAGCGAGAEAIWLAIQGWRVTAVDISGTALSGASERAEAASVSDRLTWVETYFTTWGPEDRWDLVVTNYAHPAVPQLEFYEHISKWVAPGGTLLIVGHLHDHTATDSGHQSPHGATATPSGITAVLDKPKWDVNTAQKHTRALTSPGGHQIQLHDVVVRATRHS